MKYPLKHNISVPLNKVEAFLDALDKGVTPEESARIANELIAAMRKAREKLQQGFDDKNLTVCIGKVAHVNPRDVQRLISGEIDRLTIYRRKKDTRHMPLYMKHTPQFYLDNKPVVAPDARNRKPYKPRNPKKGA